MAKESNKALNDVRRRYLMTPPTLQQQYPQVADCALQLPTKEFLNSKLIQGFNLDRNGLPGLDQFGSNWINFDLISKFFEKAILKKFLKNIFLKNMALKNMVLRNS